MEHSVEIGDWVKPRNGALPAPGMWIGKVCGKGTYSTLDIPAYMVETASGQHRLVVAEVMEYWFTPEGRG